MIEEVLAVVPTENKKYISEFQKLTQQGLTIKQLDNLCSEKSIVGHVLKGIFGYEKNLHLARLEDVKEIRRRKLYDDTDIRFGTDVWLKVGYLSKTCSLGIGSKDGNLEIFSKENKVNSNHYFLKSGNQKTEEPVVTKWVLPSQKFLNKTHDLLPPNFKNDFSCLKQ